jgi:hypothetical protein
MCVWTFIANQVVSRYWGGLEMNKEWNVYI